MNKLDKKLEKKLSIALNFFGRPDRKFIPYNIEIKNYYQNTRWLLFRLFASKKGFMHIGLNKNGVYKKNKGYELFQPFLVNKFIYAKHAMHVLELGCGQGANLNYLAYKNPNVSFWGIDLCPSYTFIRKNIKIISGDYHDLSRLPNSSVEIIYAIETLCYAENIEKVLLEAYRVLKKDGFLIVFDAYRKKPESYYSATELLFLETIEDGFRLKQFPSIKYFNQAIRQSGFSCLKELDLKKYTIGYLNNVSTRIKKYLRLGTLLKIFLQLFPDDVLGGMKAGFLIEDSIKYNITTYKLHILKK